MKIMKKVLRTLAAATLFLALTAGTVFASEIYSMGGVGPGSSDMEKKVALVKAKMMAGEMNAPTGEYLGLLKDGDYYLFEGKRYAIVSDWGTHKLTGYVGNVTACGTKPIQYHSCAASSELPFGTVLVVEGVSGPEKDSYNGLYVVEDRGGSAVESGAVLDLYFDSLEDARKVTDRGWTTANVWVAVPVDWD